MESIKYSNWLECYELKDVKEVACVLVCGPDMEEINSSVTIVIPTYNRPDYLKNSLDSALNQTYSDYNIVVLDNSEDKDSFTKKMMVDYCETNNNISYYQNSETLKMFDNWNRCFFVTKSKYICILHDDDLIYPEYLENIMNVFQSKKCGIISVFSRFMQTTEDGLIENEVCKHQNKIKRYFCFIRKKPMKVGLKDNFRTITAVPTACAFCREDAIRCGGFNVEYHPSADLIFYNKLGYYSGCYIIPSFLAIRRIGNSVLTESIPKCFKVHLDYLEVLRKQLYKGRKKRWIVEYGAAVNQLIFLSRKYGVELDIEKILIDNNCSLKWLKMPNVVLELIKVGFWLRVLIKGN